MRLTLLAELSVAGRQNRWTDIRQIRPPGDETALPQAHKQYFRYFQEGDAVRLPGNREPVDRRLKKVRFVKSISDMSFSRTEK